MKKRRKGIVLIPDGYEPSEDELWAASIIANEYAAEVEFMEPSNAYEEQTADILVDGIKHEIKTPRSIKSNRIFSLLWEGSKQADIIILNSRATTLSVSNRSSRCAE